MNAGGSMTGGSTTKSAGVLSRANDLARLEGERAKQSQQLEALQKQLSEAASSAAKTEFELSAVRQQLREAEDEVLRRTEEEKQAAALRDAMEANLASIDAELQRIEARNGGDGGRLDMLRTQREQLGVQLAALETEILAAQSAAARRRPSRSLRLWPKRWPATANRNCSLLKTAMPRLPRCANSRRRRPQQ